MRRLRLTGGLMLAVAALALALPAGRALADGDPGSDVLVYQNLFVGTDAGFSISGQARIGAELSADARGGAPLRVAVISGPRDLGAVTALWRKPQAYANFLGLELSLAYKGRLLIVMPNGFGLHWPGHSTASGAAALGHVPIGSGGAGLLRATQRAIGVLTSTRGGGAAASGGGTGSSAAASAHAQSGASGSVGSLPPANQSGAATNPGQSADSRVAVIALVLIVLALAAWGARALLARGRSASGPSGPGAIAHAVRRQPLIPGLVGMLVLAGLVVVGIQALSNSGTASASSDQALATNPELDPGTLVNRPAPDFTLDDQFGRPVSLHSFRGKVVLLAFTDSECTTVCPLTTTAMLDAKAMLGSAASKVVLLGVDANPSSNSLEDVLSYSELHGMLNRWQFLTGPLAQLRHVWKDYAIEADIERGLISHTPALMVIGPGGKEEKVYITQQSYAAIGQFGQLLAKEAASLLPGHPRIRSGLSYAPIAGVSPAAKITLPRASGGIVPIGPGAPRLSLFFATWAQAVTSLAGHMSSLNAYAAQAVRSGLPALTGVDEGSVEPSASALPAFLARLPAPLSYPVAIDRTGRVADGYEVLGQPWFVLTSASGHILWYRQVSTAGWPSETTLVSQVKAALAREPGTPTSANGIARELAGSPAPLASLHAQADQILGSYSGLATRVRALRGYPIVINAWASWCAPCRTEFSLFASASAQLGRRVAFIGADTNDSPGDAHAFLLEHPVGYPSYRTTTSDMSPLAFVGYLPTTIFINAKGKVVYVHTGQYFAQGSLDGDIDSYALGG